ncbi:hypothetical protein [Thiolapillus sp.]|uniref:hypothetical protein n=1 Tax=Thiolapillus sp. TaxID=2017437 RepID=UPI003AF40D34
MTIVVIARQVFQRHLTDCCRGIDQLFETAGNFAIPPLQFDDLAWPEFAGGENYAVFRMHRFHAGQQHGPQSFFPGRAGQMHQLRFHGEQLHSQLDLSFGTLRSDAPYQANFQTLLIGQKADDVANANLDVPGIADDTVAQDTAVLNGKIIEKHGIAGIASGFFRLLPDFGLLSGNQSRRSIENPSGMSVDTTMAAVHFWLLKENFVVQRHQIHIQGSPLS